MNADDKSKLKAYEELIGSLEHTNGLQHRKNLQPFNREKNISEWKKRCGDESADSVVNG